MNTINIERIKLARESRGLTQTNLAKMLSFNQATLSKIEKGLYHVTEDMINEISGSLSYNTSFFYKDHDVYPLKHFYFRKNLGTTVTNSKKIESMVNIISSNVRDLLDSIDIEINIEYLDLEKELLSPEEVAMKVRQLFNLPKGPIKNIVKSIEAQGIILHFVDFSKELKISGVSFITPEGVPLIIVNNNIPNSRKVFTIAHELGHIIMHYKGAIIGENRDVEKEADRFASEFLMPTRDIKNSLFNINNGEVFALKGYWKVSAQALMYKARNLGCITMDQYRRWVTRMNMQGYRMLEPYEFEIDTPSLMVKLFILHFEDLEYNVSDIINLFGLNSEEFYRYYVLNYPDLNKYMPSITRSKISLKLT